MLAPRAGEYAVIAGVAGVLAPLTLTLVELSGTVGRYDQAVRYFERAIEECGRAVLQSDTVRTQLAWARIALSMPHENNAFVSFLDLARPDWSPPHPLPP